VKSPIADAQGVKHVHLSVHPPERSRDAGRAHRNATEVARAYAISKLRWIRDQQRGLWRRRARRRAASSPGDSLPLGSALSAPSGSIATVKPVISLDHRRITLAVRPAACLAVRERVLHEWHKALLHDALPDLIAKWEPRLGVKGAGLLPAAHEDQVGKLQPPGQGTSA
jgi:hypothetical protein